MSSPSNRSDERKQIRKRGRKQTWSKAPSLEGTESNPSDSSEFEASKVSKRPKSKHRVHVHSKPATEIEDVEVSQVAKGPPSSPWRVRGAIWQKSAQDGSGVPQQKIFENQQRALCSASRQADQHVGTVRRSSTEVLNADIGRRMPVQVSPQDETEPCSLAWQTANARQAGILNSTESESFDDSEMEVELAALPANVFAPSLPLSTIGDVTKTRLNRWNGVEDDRPVRAQALSKSTTSETLQQMNLYGEAIQERSTGTLVVSRKAFVADLRREPPTHHALDAEALATYIYPANLGKIRQYQFNIVQTALQHNTLVALPTGLGKTFIAATVMLNWYRWTQTAQIVFVAPTKPLVAQQVEACFSIAGIPRSETTMLTGGVPPGIRAQEWLSKRVFFLTPQTVLNDVKTGICDPKRVVLLVVDEAHRATGNYSYVELVKSLRRFNSSFRILALTATPGSSVESVQQVIDGLNVARIEIRTEFSLDIREYVHDRPTERKLFGNSEEMVMIMELFSASLKPLLDKLRQFNGYYSADPMELTPYGLTVSRQRWMASEAGRNANAAVKGMVNRIFTVLASLAHSIDLLKYHGLGPFFHAMVGFQDTSDGRRHGKYETDIMKSESFIKMMSRLRLWVNNEAFVGHPKLEYLQELVLDHFQGSLEKEAFLGADMSKTRVMVFAQFRDSAEEIVRVLRRQEPLIRPHVFVGQATSKSSEGMDQKKQLEVIDAFKEGKYNTLVATSIGEEGLDIGEVDLIVCYDSSASPIRMLQRMGRTGRKRAGRIVLLLMKGKEENAFAKARDNYEKMQTMIAQGQRFVYHEQSSPRIIPITVKPEVDIRIVEVPIENTTKALPEPSKSGKVPKRPPKKFHMPDDARPGFVSAASLSNGIAPKDRSSASRSRAAAGRPNSALDSCPRLAEVILDKEGMTELASRYADVAAGACEIVPAVEIRYTRLQRIQRPTSLVGHGHATKDFVNLLQKLQKCSNMDTQRLNRRVKMTKP